MSISWAVALIMQSVLAQLDYEIKLQRVVGGGLVSNVFLFLWIMRRLVRIEVYLKPPK